MGSADYRLDLNVTSGPVFFYSYDGGIGFNLYNPSTNATRPSSYEKEEHIYLKTKQIQEYKKGKVLVNSWDDAEPVTIILTLASISCKLSHNAKEKLILRHTIMPQAPLSHNTHGWNRISNLLWNYMICPALNKDLSSTTMINGRSARDEKQTQKKKFPPPPQWIHQRCY